MGSNDWIEWKWSPEKTYPETLETEVFVRMRDGDELSIAPLTVGFWYSDTPEHSNWFNTHADDDPSGLDIVAYKLTT